MITYAPRARTRNVSILVRVVIFKRPSRCFNVMSVRHSSLKRSRNAHSSNVLDNVIKSVIVNIADAEDLSSLPGKERRNAVSIERDRDVP